MSAKSISKILEDNFRNTFFYLCLAFIVLAAFLSCTFLYFGVMESKNQAENALRTYKSNLVSIFILNEQAALDVAINAMNEGITMAKFKRDIGQILSPIDFRANIETAGQVHGTLIYSIKPINGSSFWAFLISSVLWTATIAAGFVAFRRSKEQLVFEVSRPLELLSEKIRYSDRLGEQHLFETGFQELAEPKALEILELQNAIKRYDREITQAHKEAIAARQDKAIAQMTQALAHDVRKPFTMFKAIVDAIEVTEDPAEARMFLRESIFEVNQAMAAVEGMIQDVMQIGSNAKPLQEDTAPETLIENVLRELFRIYPNSDIDISYDLKHSHNVFVDTLRVGRVFSNILGNALQAMEFKGNIWIFTTEERGLVKFTLGNAGSFIPQESLPKLFDAFFTSGKKGGTGLGLAIAKKIVEAHGGTIHCESKKTAEQPEGQVEFIFTLPATTTKVAQRSESLPLHAKEIFTSLEAARAQMRENSKAAEPAEYELERELKKHLKHNKQKHVVLLVDDEAVYRNSFAANFEKIPFLGPHFHLEIATNSRDALKLATQKTPRLVLEDVDLGPNSLNGIEVIKELRKQGHDAFVCVHSNRFLSTDIKTALEAGADMVLPKPISKAHLLKILLMSLIKPIKTSKTVEQIETKATYESSYEAPTRKPTFAYVDDTRSFLVGMRLKIRGEATLHEFISPEDFLAKVQNDDDFLASLDFLVTDFHFAEGVKLNGLTFAKTVRSLGFQRPILIASNGDIERTDLEKYGVNALLPKIITGWADLVHWAK